MLNEITFEFNRVYKSKLYMFFLALFMLLTYYALNSGITQYENFIEERDTFIKNEADTFKRLVTYSQYGDKGFRILFEPGNESLFFDKNTVFDNLYSNIDMTEIIKINTVAKGKKIFSSRSSLKDAAGIFFIFGSLIAILLGMSSYSNEKHFFKFKNVLIRLFILIPTIALYMAIVYFIPKFHGIRITNNSALSGFGLFALLFFCFLYSAGVFLRVLFKNRLFRIIAITVVWFLFIYITPELYSDYLEKTSSKLPSDESINIKKITELMNFEREVKEAIKNVKTIQERDEIYKQKAGSFFKNGYVRNRSIETEINEEVKGIFEKFENLSSFNPASFYSLLCGEVSSKGYEGYDRFVNYVLILRHNFIEFFLHKRYESNDTVLESFVKANENIFKAQGRLPKYFWKASGLTCLYTIILFSISYFILLRRRKKKQDTLKPDFIADQGYMYYLYCENDTYMGMIYRHYQQQPDTVCLDKVNGRDIDPGVSLTHLVSYYQKTLNANRERTFENLERLGITDLKAEKPTPENVKKVYCAVCLAVECDTIVIKDFIKRESRKFERQFLGLLKYLMEQETTVIYLGVDSLQSYSSYKEDIEFEKYLDFKIDNPLSFILR